MIVLKIIFILLGIFFCLAEEYIFGIILIIIGLAINSKKKEQAQPQPQRAQQPQRTRQMSQADIRRIEDRKRYLLAEIQMCQQRINSIEMQENINVRLDNSFDVVDAVGHIANMGSLKKEYELLAKLRKEYNDLCNL